MKYIDRVYGEFEITEPVILELISSPTLQRLKDIDQAGYIEPYFPGTYYSRFDHSVGVYLLLKKYGAPIEEQIAGLIHDVSHSVFSHCIDYALTTGSQKEHNHQDTIFDSYVCKTEIPKILKKFGLSAEYILDDKNFPLKETTLPDLCADRIDYSLRTAVVSGELSERDKDYLLEHLSVENTKWVFRDLKSAKKYAELFFKLNTVHYAGFASAIMLKTVGDCVEYALQERYISENDLYTTDTRVIEKIKSFLNKDEKLQLFWERMNNKIKVQNNPNDYTVEVFVKSRAVDPLFIDIRTAKRVSEVELPWSEVVKEELKPKRYFLKFER